MASISPVHPTGNIKFLVSASALALALTAPASAIAQPGGLALEEIVVTARKREENLQSVPISVTAFTADTLRARSITSLADLNNSAPNLGWQPPPVGGGGSSAFFIRGIGQFDYIATADQSVGLYVDGVYVARSIGALLNVIDIERVEVLRGPQGTLFGRNTPAGAVQIVSQKPSLEDFSASIELTTGSHERIDAKATANLPLSSNAAFKLTAATLNQDGYGKSLLTGTDLNKQEDYYVRGQLRLEPGENLRIDLTADWSKRKGSSSSLKLISMDDADPFLGIYNIMLMTEGFPTVSSANFVDGSRYDSWKGVPSVDESEIYSLTGQVEWDVAENVMLKSITGYRSMENYVTEDFDGTPYPIVDQTVDTDADQFSQELQLNGKFLDDRLTVVSGVFFFRESVKEIPDGRVFMGISRSGPGTFDFLPDPLVDGLPAPFPPFSFVNNLNSTLNIDQTTRSYAAFGEATYAISDAWSFTAGIRYSHDRKNLTQSVTGRGPVTVKDSWSALTPRFSLSWQPQDTLMAYVSASRGFRSGGFNGRESSAPVPSSYKPEFLWSYEFGLKADLMDRRLRVNSTAFYYDYKDRQGTVLRPDQSITVGNIGAVEMYGAEIEVIAVPTDGLRLEASLGLLHHKITKINATGGIPGLTLASDLENAPEVTASAAAQYRFELGDMGSLTLRGDVYYKGAHEFLLPNYPGERQKGYALVNARATWESADENWQISLFGKNIFNKAYHSFAENTIGFGFGMLLATYGRPAEWGLSADYRF